MLKQYKFLIPLVIFTLLLFSMAGCRANPERPEAQNNESGGSNPEVPEVLEEMEETILETMYALDGIKGVEMTLAKIEETKEEITEESEVDQDQQEKEDTAKDQVDMNRMIMENSIIIPVLQEEEVEGDEMIDPQEPPQEVDEVWYKIQQNLYTIHRQWNALERHLQDAKVDQTEAEVFEELLEDLTKNIDNEEVDASLFSSNELLNKLAEYRNHFKTQVPYEVYQLRYHTRKSVLLVNEEQYDEALGETEKAKELLNGLRQRVIEKDAEVELQKLELSLDDLQHEISTENFHLVQIKAAVLMKNIELIHAPFEGGN